MTPTVALFNTHFLPYSQTFVHEEIRQHRRYAVEVFCRTRELAERFPHQPVHVGGPLYGAMIRDAGFEARFRRGGLSLVHAHFGTGAVYARHYARRYGLPLVVTFHGYDVALLQSRSRWTPTHLRYALLGPRVLREMTLGLCASEELREMLLAQGVPASRLVVHRLGIDLTRFQPGPRTGDEIRVIMVGRLVEKKGFEDGLAAFARVAGELPALRLSIVGEGERLAALRRQAETLGVTDRVSFLGALPADQVATLLSTSQVLLAPSVVDRVGNRESGLIVVKEASASETVPIGTRHGGIPEIIEDGVTGYLVAERDVAALADRLRRVATDPALRQRLGAAAREKMLREYDNVRRVAELEARYDEVVALNPPRTAAPGR